ncbi:MAG: CHC2 zinc finger domain-containing protein [Thermoguttaceae bacterium]
MNPTTDLRAQAFEYHVNLPERIREYLRRERGIADEVIDLHFLGWNGQRITVPITNREGRVTFFKLAKDPADMTDSPKMIATRGAKAELYGWERVLAKLEQIIICEGEFDRLVLESQGFAAVTSTGGALTFRREWGPCFDPIPSIYVCFDNDNAGQAGAERVARMIPQARIVRWPEDIGYGGDVTDFFVRPRRSREEFLRLLEASQPLPREERPETVNASHAGVARGEIEDLKSRTSIEKLVGRYVELRPSGKRFLARCPFHEDRRPSFVVFADTQSFYCFGCREHGDALNFLMRIENLSFGEAVRVLRQLAS